MAAAVGHRGNYPKLITLLSGKSRIIEKEYFGWSFLLSFHKNTGQTKIGVSGVSVMCTRIIIKFKQTSVPMVDGCSKEKHDWKWPEVSAESQPAKYTRSIIWLQKTLPIAE